MIKPWDKNCRRFIDKNCRRNIPKLRKIQTYIEYSYTIWSFKRKKKIKMKPLECTQWTRGFSPPPQLRRLQLRPIHTLVGSSTCIVAMFAAQIRSFRDQIPPIEVVILTSVATTSVAQNRLSFSRWQPTRYLQLWSDHPVTKSPTTEIMTCPHHYSCDIKSGHLRPVTPS